MAAMRLGGGKALASTEAWRQVTALVKEAALLGSKWCGLRCHYSDYASAATDGLGLGIGSVTASETWVVSCPRGSEFLGLLSMTLTRLCDTTDRRMQRRPRVSAASRTRAEARAGRSKGMLRGRRRRRRPRPTWPSSA